MLTQLLQDCISAFKAALKKDSSLSDAIKASLLVAITACDNAASNPSSGACYVASEELGEVASMLSSCTSEECKAAAIAACACAEACRREMYRKEDGRIYRFIRFDGSKIDREAKTIPISFSSEHPALQRCGDTVSPEQQAAGLAPGQTYIEILDHDSANVDLSLLNNRGAFLDEHQEQQQIGVVERAEIVDRVGRAVVKLDSTDLGVKRFSQMADNVRPHISAGYKYTRFIGDEKLPDGRVAKRFAWRGLELSSVAVPADPTVGVARAYQDLPSVDNPQKTKSEKISDTGTNNDDMKRSLILLDPVPAIATGGGGGTIDQNKILTDERARTAEISTVTDALIKVHGTRNGGKLGEQIRTLANEALNRGTTANDFKIRAMEEVLSAKPAKPVTMADCADADGQRNYSLLRAVQSALKRKEEGKSAIPDGLEGEVHQEVLRRSVEAGGLGYEAQGFQVPADANMRLGRGEAARMTRDMQATVFNAGGAFVPTTLMVPIIEILRNMEVLDKVGMRTMAGLQGNIIIPRQEATATAYSVSEIGALTASQQILGQIALAPKRVGATQTYSKQFVMQSTPDAEQFMRDDILKVIALYWDRMGITGQGAANEPQGIINTPGIGSIVFGATPTYIKLVAMETAIREQNVNDPIAYLSTPTVRGTLKTVAEALTGATTIGGSQNAIWKGGTETGAGTVNGYPAWASNQIPNHKVIAGAFTHLIKAMWGGLDVVVDYFTKAGNAEVVVTMNTWGDFAVRHPQAFIASADAGNQ